MCSPRCLFQVLLKWSTPLRHMWCPVLPLSVPCPWPATPPGCQWPTAPRTIRKGWCRKWWDSTLAFDVGPSDSQRQRDKVAESCLWISSFLMSGSATELFNLCSCRALRVFFATGCIPTPHHQWPNIFRGPRFIGYSNGTHCPMINSLGVDIGWSEPRFLRTDRPFRSHKAIIEGSLEVKLLTIWTDEAAEMGRVREEKESEQKESVDRRLEVQMLKKSRQQQQEQQ